MNKMLEPHDRRLLFESLRPPAGYTLDSGIGTTFSLDLLALLAAPLAFSLFSWGNDEDPLRADPLALLEAIRRYSDKLTVFCQAGQIAIPRRHQQLFGYLEDSVIGVTPQTPEAVFHPKVWILRFSAPNGPVLYRLICMSRNLTFDHSWDTLLVLDGELVERDNAFAANHPLGDFVGSLHKLAIRPVPERTQAEIDRMQEEVRRVRFELPDGFERISFFPLGIEGARTWPFRGRIDRILVVSPFLSAKCLSRLSRKGEGNILVSRLENLASLDPKCLEGFERVKVLSQGANSEVYDAETPNGDADVPLVGLHAKLFIIDAGWEASVWTGSANATDPAFGGNIEFLVGMTGSKAHCGVDSVLGQLEGETSFGDLLQDFTLGDQMNPPDPTQERLDRLVEATRRALAKASLKAVVTLNENMQSYRMQLRVAAGGVLDLPTGITTGCWPVTLNEASALPVTADKESFVEFSNLSFEALTSFLAFHVEATDEDKKASARFVLNLPLEGAPADRRERILRSVLQDKDRLLRLLLLLLSEGESDIANLLMESAGEKQGQSQNASPGLGVPLFESLIRALDRDPAKLDQIARLIEDLRKTSDGEKLLPEGFELVWRPIWSAREKMSR
jgi:hypothetical protein